MSNLTTVKGNPRHIAIIMDGNRRWAKEKKLQVKEGHKAGAENLKKIAKYCNSIGIEYLTVYAFSTENWKRSEEEVSALMKLLKTYLDMFAKEAMTENIRICGIGDISGLSKTLQNGMNNVVKKTKDNTGLTLNIAFNYGGRAELVNSIKKIAQKIESNEIKIEDIDENMISNNLYTAGQLEPDLLIRPGGEYRTSNFLPWQLVYSEFYFTDTYWPDFNEDELEKALQIYRNRNRRFGGN